MDLNLVPKKLVKLLMEITPGPLGNGLTIKEASEKLGINRDTVYSWLKEFEEQFPTEYENWKGIMGTYERQRNSTTKVGNIEYYEDKGYIKDVF